MKRFIVLALAIGFGGATAAASNLKIDVKSPGSVETGGFHVITAAPNSVITFQIEGILSDDLNEGLALVGFDLHFTGGPLPDDTIAPPSAAIAAGNPMGAFVKPDGITNPLGFGGTPNVIVGDLVQIGGGQNTIRNSVNDPSCTPNCASFPVGAVVPGVAQPGGLGTAVIATGSLTVPSSGGPYELQVIKPFANVIKDGETGAVFFATLPAGIGPITNLRINISAPCSVVSTPPNCAIDARQPREPDPDIPAARQWNSVAMTFEGVCGVTGAVPGDFTVTVVPGNAGPNLPDPTVMGVNAVSQAVTVQLSRAIPAGSWTCITHTGTGKQVCLGSLPADVNSDRTAAPAEILDVIDNLNGVLNPPLAVHQCDFDRSAVCDPVDILTEIDLLNGASGFLVWNGKTLPACPSAAP